VIARHHQPAAASRTPAFDGLIHVVTLATLVVMMSVSPMALTMIGWNYEGLGGSGPTRFHPGTYLAVILYIAIALRDGNPLTSVIGAFTRDPRLALFLAAWAMLLYHAAANQKLPAAALVDTFLLPLLLLQIYLRLEARTRAGLVSVIHAMFVINALLGLGEFLSGLRLTPFVAAGVAITDEWRSTALLGHPLGNALMTSCYALILLIGGGGLSPSKRRAILALQFAAMIAFGGRTSLVLLYGFGGIALLRMVYLFAAGGRIRLAHLTALALALPIVALALGALYEIGVFDKLILRFIEDKGSTEARIVMFELFNGFTLREILLGPPQETLSYLVHVNRLEFGIESLWVAFVLYYGAIPSLIFFTGLVFFLAALVSHCQTRAWAVLAYYFFVNSTFLGLAGKTINFGMLCLLLLALLPIQARSARTTIADRAYPASGAPAC
jgi:hypothetical protein